MATPETIGAVSALIASRRRKDILLFIMLFLTLLGLTPLFILGGAAVGFAVLFGSLAVLLLTILVFRWPTLGFYLVALSVFLIEQEPLVTPIFTDNLYVFHWPAQLEGFIERPIGILIIFTLTFWLIQRFVQR